MNTTMTKARWGSLGLLVLVQLGNPALARAAVPQAPMAEAAQAPGREVAAEAASAASAQLGDVAHDEPIVHSLGRRLRCPVCQGMSIGDSPAPMAQDMMRQVRRMRLAGRSEAEIVAYFTERYGEWVMLDPPKHGAGLFVWVLPPLALAVGLLLAINGVRRRIRKAYKAGAGLASKGGALAAAAPAPAGSMPAGEPAHGFRSERRQQAGEGASPSKGAKSGAGAGAADELAAIRSEVAL